MPLNNLIQDTKDAKKKGLSKLQNLSNVIKAKQSLAKETALKNVMGSIDSINEKSNNLIEYFLDLIKVGGGNESITRIRKNLVKFPELNYFQRIVLTIISGLGISNEEIKEL